MYKFFVTENQIKDDIIDIIEEDVNHIKNVLRLKVDEQIEICNVSNSITYLCKILEIGNKIVKCKILQKLENSNETNVYIHIFQGFPKAEKMETIIQKTTEIGVDEITPVIMKRCVIKLDNKSIENKISRFRKIAEVAAKQSKRDKIPIINLPINFKNIYENIKDYDIVFVAYEEEKQHSIKSILKNITRKENLKIGVIIGPEGGIDKEEIEDLLLHNIKSVTLGKRILRTETAPIVISSIIMYELDEMEGIS